MLGKFFNALKGGRTPNTSVEFAFLDEVKPGLGALVSEYFETGEPEALLTQLPSLGTHRSPPGPAHESRVKFNKLPNELAGEPEKLVRHYKVKQAMGLHRPLHPTQRTAYGHRAHISPGILEFLIQFNFGLHAAPADLLSAVKLLGGSDLDVVLHALSVDKRHSNNHGIHPLKDFAPAPEAIQTALELVEPKRRGFAIESLRMSPSMLGPELQPYLAAQLGQTSSKLCEAAAAILLKHPAPDVVALAQTGLTSKKASEREAYINMLGALGGAEARDLLTAHREVEKSDALKTKIDLFLGTSETTDEAHEDGYVDCHGDFVAVPEFEPLVDDGREVVDEEDASRLQVVVNELYAAAKAGHQKQLEHWQTRKNGPKPTFDANPSVQPVIDWLNGVGSGEKIFPYHPLASRRDRRVDINAAFEPIAPKIPMRRLLKLAAARRLKSLVQIIEAAHNSGELDFAREMEVFETENITRWYARTEGDGLSYKEQYLSVVLRQAYAFRPGLWVWAATHLDLIAQALPPHTSDPHKNRAAMRVLSDFPTLPKVMIGPLLLVAIGAGPKLRLVAEEMLQDVPGIDAMLIELLADKRQDIRGNAARFLKRRGAKDALPALVKRLKAEKSETARAEMIAAVQALGGDVAPYISRDALEKEAKTLVSKVANTKITWLDLRAAPGLHWADGTPADPVMLDAWTRLALKLKSPIGSPLLTLYLAQMTEGSVRQVADWLLDAWLGYDLAGMAGTSRNRFYPNSAAESKALLALTHHATPAKACSRIAAYLKTHGRRVAQAKALIETLYAMGTRDAVQVLVATSTRFKQRTVRELASELVKNLADERGWSEDELADRSVATGGFDEAGQMALSVGAAEKVYTARLADDLSITLSNPDGRVVKSIPAGNDDATKEAKALLSAAKKSVKVTLEGQSARLYDAMVRPRAWTFKDWQSDLMAHPLLARMATRLIWRGLDADGGEKVTFRPTLEGDFYTPDGDDADLGGLAQVDLAHSANLTEATRAAWQGHFTDFEITPLFAQISRPLLVLTDEMQKQTALTDREGWISTNYKLAAQAKKFGYERGAAGDGGGYDQLSKPFQGAGLVAHLGFTGSYMDAEEFPAAITQMSFSRTSPNSDNTAYGYGYYGYSQSGHGSHLTLKDVPAVLLSEVWNDLHEIAEIGAFDPDWKNKSYY